MSELNKYVLANYQTGDIYVHGLEAIANKYNVGIEEALEIALQDLEQVGALEHVEPTSEAFRWLRNGQETES